MLSITVLSTLSSTVRDLSGARRLHMCHARRISAGVAAVAGMTVPAVAKRVENVIAMRVSAIAMSMKEVSAIAMSTKEASVTAMRRARKVR